MSIRDVVTEILTSNGFVIEDVLGSDEIGLIYAFNKNFIK